MPGQSVVYTSAEAFQNYVRQYQMDLYRQLYYGFKTSFLATPFEGIKGQLILNESVISGNLAKRWSKTFAPVAAVEIKPRTLSTVLEKIDLSVVPQEYEASYLGAMRRKGQDPLDWPFEAFILSQVMAKLAQEQEYAIWQGDAAAVPSSNDLLSATFDGYLKIIADEVTATNLTEVTTGAIDSTNAVASFRTMWAEVSSAYKEMGVDIFCSYEIFDAYRINYKDDFGANPVETSVINEANYSAQGLRYELGGGNSQIIPIPGLEGSGRVIMTPRANLCYGMDSPSDQTFNFDTDTRELRYWMDFRMGCQIMIAKDGIMTVNDQA